MTGPSHWCENFPVANGPRQSPIDIIPSQAQFDSKLKQLKLKYDPSTSKGILNNGHSFQVDFATLTDESDHSRFPSLLLKQEGSEHTVGGTKFPCELHLVHWNTKYPNFGEAVSKPDGLAVVGVFLKIGGANPSLQKVLDACDAIKSKGKQTTFSNFDPKTLKFLDLGSHLIITFFFLGTWLVVIPVLRKLTLPLFLSFFISFSPSFSRSADGETPRCMVDNYRPPQPLKGRKVCCSFK
uniref:Carbonic anhydrase n=1 Tax=Astyanax mexicanus TaxID=7994 RepID=A0A8B9LMM2_ASTMX